MEFNKELMKVKQFLPSEDTLEEQLHRTNIILTKFGLYGAIDYLGSGNPRRFVWVTAFSKDIPNPILYADDCLKEFDKRFPQDVK